MPVPVLLSFPVYLLIASAVQDKVWSFGRFALNGFDYEATLEVLSKDTSTDIERLADNIQVLSRAKDISHAIEGTCTLKQSLDSLPENVRRTLNTSTQLEPFIRAVVTQSVARSVRPLLGTAKLDNEDNDHYLTRLLYGLMLTGRAETKLTPEQRTSSIDALLRALEPTEENAHMRNALMSFSASGDSYSLVSALHDLRAMETVSQFTTTGCAAEHVVYALGGTVLIEDRPGSLIDEISDLYPVDA